MPSCRLKSICRDASYLLDALWISHIYEMEYWRHIHSGVLVYGIATVMREDKVMIAIALSKPFLPLAIKPCTIIEAVIRVYSLLCSISSKSDGACHCVNMLDTSCHYIITEGDTIEQFTITVIEEIITFSRTL